MSYHPLPPHNLSIRVLTILTSKDGPQYATGPVHCTLEHVCIDDEALSEAHVTGLSTVGVDGIWPDEGDGNVRLFRFEPRPRGGAAGSDVLWQDGGEPAPSDGCSEEQNVRPAEQSDDSNLPWRYKWGDYVALSYVWGNVQDTCEIFVNGISTQVTRNLGAALHQLRRCCRIQQGFKVWVDALCINQADLAERSVQVGRMRDVYAKAWHVVVFLGVEEDESDVAMAAVKYLSRRFRQAEPLEGFYRRTKAVDLRPLVVVWERFKSPLRQEVYRALYHFLNRKYWQRLWILQEIASGRHDTPVLCGRRTVYWREIFEAASFVQLDEHRFGRDILASVDENARSGGFSWNFTEDRLPRKGNGGYTSPARLWKLTLSIMALQKAQHSLEDDDQLSAFQCLLLTRDALATDEKDKVYGILGLTSIAKLVDIAPDYTLSVEETFYSFSRALSASGDLRFLRLVERPIAQVDEVYSSWLQELTSPFVKRPLLVRNRADVLTGCACGLPSWVVCWRCPHTRTAHLLGQYTAAGHTRADTVFSSSGKVLTTQAVMFDTVNSVSAFHRLESDHQYPSNGQPTLSIYGDTSATKTALWRTITGDTTREGDWAPNTYSCLLNPLLWAGGIAGVRTNNMGLHDFMARNKDLQVFEHSLKQLLAKGSVTKRMYNPGPVEVDAASWAMNVLAWRRLVTSDGGYLGLAPAATLPSDGICVLLGCNVPLVLRPRGELYEIVGECYVHGIMKGEVMRGVEEGRYRLENISIC